MLRIALVAVVAVAIALTQLATTTSTVEATVHPIQSGECSGAGFLDPAGGEPPGISGGSNAENIARPLFATGVLLGFDENDEPIIDPDNPALNGESGVEHCPNAP
jgi:hypothetical protein